jgi:allantoin racemase
MTERIGAVANAVASPGAEIIACNPESGPAAIEGHYDEASSVIGVVDEIRKGEFAFAPKTP